MTDAYDQEIRGYVDEHRLNVKLAAEESERDVQLAIAETASAA